MGLVMMRELGFFLATPTTMLQRMTTENLLRCVLPTLMPCDFGSLRTDANMTSHMDCSIKTQGVLALSSHWLQAVLICIDCVCSQTKATWHQLANCNSTPDHPRVCIGNVVDVIGIAQWAPLLALAKQTNHGHSFGHSAGIVIVVIIGKINCRAPRETEQWLWDPWVALKPIDTCTNALMMFPGHVSQHNHWNGAGRIPFHGKCRQRLDNVVCVCVCQLVTGFRGVEPSTGCHIPGGANGGTTPVRSHCQGSTPGLCCPPSGVNICDNFLALPPEHCVGGSP